MVFCNIKNLNYPKNQVCHNPYFNRWFSAITKYTQDKLLDVGHNPYFNRWFSAICEKNHQDVIEL